MNNKETTIYDIAKVLRVSPATVSRGLKDHPGIRKDTRKKIQETAQKMGYQHNMFASSLRRKQTNTIGVIVPRLNSYFMSTVISGMEKCSEQSHGYNLIISQSQESYKKEIDSVQAMFNSRIDGLMVSLASDTKKIEHFDALLNKTNTTDILRSRSRASRVYQHRDRQQKGGIRCQQHLISQGCKRIVHIDGNTNRNVYADRLSGYKKALSEKKIPFDPALVIKNNLSDQAGMEAAQTILQMKKMPDGIFAANDTSAVACIRELKQAGIKIPDTIAVVGFNNDPIARVVEPNLTTIEYPGQEMGEVAATTLINKLRNTPAITAKQHCTEPQADNQGVVGEEEIEQD